MKEQNPKESQDMHKKKMLEGLTLPDNQAQSIFIGSDKFN
jgi:hypothetical protein